MKKKLIIAAVIAAILSVFFLLMIITAVFSAVTGDGEADSQTQTEETTGTDETDADTAFSTVFKGGKWVFPAPKYVRVSSEFGGRTHPVTGKYKYHSGMDLAAPGGSPIVAAATGKVSFSGVKGGYGNCVMIDHGGGVTTLYGHASKLLVSKGQVVIAGQQIAKVGSTGLSTGNHLHFEVRINGNRTNPRPYIFGK